MEIAHEQMTHKEDVVFTGRLEQEELSELMASALALVYVSYFEGFGIPLLEALYCDTPVITSGKSSLPEVSGEAGLYVDPFSVDDICLKMSQLYWDQGLRLKLISKAKEQRDKYSWDKTAEALYNCLISAHKE